MDTPLNMPTAQSVHGNSHAQSIDDFNRQMRSQPWYQQWFQRQGLDPNHVQLSGDQRKQLQQLVLQNGGVPPDAFNDMKIDPAGNLNTEHGFASQPTWLKALEIGAPLAATAGFGAAGMGPMAGMMGTTGSGAAGAAAAPGALSSTILGSSAATAGNAAAAGMAGTAGVAGATAAPGGVMAHLLGKVPGAVQNFADAGSLMESFANDQANNRVTQGNFSQGYDRNMLAAQQDRRTAETDAMRKIGESSYIANGGSQFKPVTLSLNGQQRTAPNMGFGPTAPSDAQKQAASTLQAEMLKRLQPGGSYTPQPLDSYAKPSTSEKVGQYGSLATAGLGLAKNIFGF